MIPFALFRAPGSPARFSLFLRVLPPGALSVGALPFFARTGSPKPAFFLFLCKMTKPLAEPYKKP